LHSFLFSLCVQHAPSSAPSFITLTKLGVQYRSWNSTLRSFIQPSVISSLLGPDISVSILFFNTLNLCSSVSVRDQVSHPHKTTGKNCISATMHVFCLSLGALYEITTLFEEHAVVFAVWLNTSRCASYGPMTEEPELRGMWRRKL
jgi:hypothetical protein